MSEPCCHRAYGVSRYQRPASDDVFSGLRDASTGRATPKHSSAIALSASVVRRFIVSFLIVSGIKTFAPSPRERAT